MTCYAVEVCAIPEETLAIWGYAPKSGITDVGEIRCVVCGEESTVQHCHVIAGGYCEWKMYLASLRLQRFQSRMGLWDFSVDYHICHFPFGNLCQSAFLNVPLPSLPSHCPCYLFRTLFYSYTTVFYLYKQKYG